MKWSLRKALGLETKDILPWRGGLASTENADNFVRNQATVISAWELTRGKGALGLSATWACVNLLAGTIASLPLMVYRDVKGVRQIARDHPLYWVLHDSPNYAQTAVDFWEQQIPAIELQGNAYARIFRRDNGEINSLIPIKPDAVNVVRKNGRLEYRLSEDGREIVLPTEDVLHIRGPMGDALGGLSTLAACGGVFSTAEAIESAAGQTFASGMRSPGALSTADNVTLTTEQRESLLNHLRQHYVGQSKDGLPLLLDRGMKWQGFSISPDDAQMLESRRFGVEDICRIFGVPPHMIGHTENSTSWGTGIEQMTLGFVKFSLRRRLKRIEQALEKQLLTAADRVAGMRIEFNLEGLLRGDSKGRSDFYQVMVRNGLMTRNECRALENLPPIDGGDVVMVQMQDVPLTDAIEGQEA